MLLYANQEKRHMYLIEFSQRCYMTLQELNSHKEKFCKAVGKSIDTDVMLFVSLGFPYRGQHYLTLATVSNERPVENAKRISSAKMVDNMFSYKVNEYIDDIMTGSNT